MTNASRLFVFSLFFCSPALSVAETPGDKVIRLVDEAMTRAKDQSMEYHVVTDEKGKPTRTMDIQVRLKGKEWRRVDFLAPGDVKGMKVLILSLSQMYVYLPAYRKVRRVASHVREQSFMGTTMSHDDMSLVTFGGTFSGKLLSENKTSYVVEAMRKPKKNFPYKKLIIKVRKDINQPTEIRYYNNKGQHVKTESRGDFTCEKKICNPKTIKMVDHTRNNAVSTMHRTKWTPNPGLAESVFTVRGLLRSH